ncbi:MAG: hypothetical protein ACTHJ8_12590 [Mucilaginibacter sp.]
MFFEPAYQNLNGMEAAFVNNNLSSGRPLKEAISAFFNSYTPESAKALCWTIFRCWAIKECKSLADVPDQEIALFLDQLINLVAAAYIEHEANRVSQTRQEGSGDE